MHSPFCEKKFHRETKHDLKRHLSPTPALSEHNNRGVFPTPGKQDRDRDRDQQRAESKRPNPPGQTTNPAGRGLTPYSAMANRPPPRDSVSGRGHPLAGPPPQPDKNVLARITLDLDLDRSNRSRRRGKRGYRVALTKAAASGKAQGW